MYVSTATFQNASFAGAHIQGKLLYVTTSAEKVRAIRERLGIGSQEEFAKLCGMERLEIQGLEKGRNKGTSYAARAGLAKGVAVPIEALAAYLDGGIGIDDLWSLRGSDQAAMWWREVLRLKKLDQAGPPKSGRAAKEIEADLSPEIPAKQHKA